MTEQEKNQAITKDMTFKEVLEKYPETVKVFLEYELHCIGCPMSALEKIEQGARAHRIDVNKLIEDLNKVVEEKE